MFFQRMLYRARILAALAFALCLAACGGGSGSGSSSGGGGSTANGTNCSQPTSSDVNGCGYVSLSDTSGQFLTYTVTVKQFTLTRQDGITQNVLPGPTTVDFARYAAVSEFLSLNAMPSGNYVSGVLTLDYSGSDIVAQDGSGNAVKLAPVDSSGHALGTQTVTVTFDNSHMFGLFAGTPELLNLDFDLDASNIVNSNHTVTVEPVLFATIDPSGVTQQIRGVVDSVDTGNNSFTVDLRPSGSGDYGKVIVYSVSNTSFVANQKVSFGASGISALKANGDNKLVLVQGSFNLTNHHFEAQQVFAGSSVPGGSADSIEGIVTARSGNTLTLRSAAVSRAGQGTTFSDGVTVTLGTGTVVRASKDPGTTLNSTDISVGQQLLVFGRLTSGSSLDASNGFALLEWTQVDGGFLAVGGTGPSTANITLNVEGFEDRPISLFDLTGTGSNPGNYVISVPCTCLGDGVGVGDNVIISGFVTPFGAAPPDFDGQTLIDFKNSGTLLSVAWNGGTGNAFSSLDAHGIVANLNSSPGVHRLLQADTITDLSASNNATVVGPSSGTFVVLKNGNGQVYTSFSSFVSAVQSALSGGAKVHGFFAVGGYSSSTHVLTATSAAVALQ